MSIIFEKVLKYRLTPHLEQNMTKFQTGGVKGKGVTDDLFLMSGVIDRANTSNMRFRLLFKTEKNVSTVYCWRTVSVACGKMVCNVIFYV